MKSYLKLFSISLSLVIFLFSIFECNLTVYASYGGGGASSDTRLDRTEWFNENGELISDKTVMVMSFLLSEAKCLVDGNFSSVMSNYFDMKEYMTSSHITMTEDVDDNGNGGLIFSEDLTAAFKQAILEYAEETNGFKIYPTIRYTSVSPSAFGSNYMYRTFSNLVRESGCIAVHTKFLDGDTLYVARPFHDITVDSVSLVATYKYGAGVMVDASFFGTNTWVRYSTQAKIFRTVSYDTDYIAHYCEYENWDDGTDLSDGVYAKPYFALLDSRAAYPTGSVRGYTLFSDDGRKLRVFNSVNALQNYTTGNRSVYFGSGFYDTPGEIQVSFDDLEKYIDGKYDSFFDDLKDLIGDNEDNLTEEDLEKLVDKILDKMDETGGNQGGGNQSGSGSDNSGLLDGISDIFEGMTSTISGYLDAILAYLQGILTDLDYIVIQMQDMTEDEVNDKSDSVISELSGLFSEVADMMSRKFPFSIPWDIKDLYVTLSGGKEPGIQSFSDDIGLDGYFGPDTSPPKPAGGFVDVIVYSSPARSSPAAGDYGIMPLVADEDMGNISPVPPSGGVSPSDSGAPVFKIPLVIKSAGINSALLIDMSYFDTVSEISRTTFLLIFLYQLFLLSMRVFEFVRSFMG